MGLLDSAPQQAMPQMGSGLLGGQAPTAQPAQMPAAQAPASSQGMQMAQQLAQNPTPQTVQMVVSALMQKGTPEAKQIADILNQVKASPDGVKQVAQALMQQMQGGQQGQ